MRKTMIVGLFLIAGSALTTAALAVDSGVGPGNARQCTQWCPNAGGFVQDTVICHAGSVGCGGGCTPFGTGNIAWAACIYPPTQN